MTDLAGDSPLMAELEGIVDYLNDEHGDALALIARGVTGRPEATAATVAVLDTGGVELLVTAPPGPASTIRVDFSSPIVDITAIRGRLIELVASARQSERDFPTTAIERSIVEQRELRTFITQVSRVVAITPRMVEVTCAGGDLVDFRPIAPDDYVFVLAPPEGRAALAIDRDFTWDAYDAMPPEERPVGACYTVRRWRPDVAELDLLVMLHGHHGEGVRWAQRARPGDPVALWGPRRVFDPPPPTTSYLLVGDETALAAIGAILEVLPTTASVEAVIEVDGPADHLPLAISPSRSITWLHRDGSDAGTSSMLFDAVRHRQIPIGTYAWGGGESRIMTAIRRHLRDEVGLGRDAVAMTAYWRRNASD